jgi:hypothetical protein
MHIVQPIATTQAIVLVPRAFAEGSEVAVYLTDESTNTTATITPSVTEADGYMTLAAIYDVNEGTFYTLEVVLSGTVIYRGRVFCTSQTDLAQYTVNENQYVTEDSYNNEFIVL